MWLINTKTFRLKEVIPENTPPYAILSHRWHNDEASFKDMNDFAKKKAKKWSFRAKMAHGRVKEGFTKIEKTCERAAAQGLQYAWIDTCCINKESSAELSEAINSMYEWYSKAKVCYVYLSDVHARPLKEEEFERSEWFQRGWTLQELIAPQRIEFLNSQWLALGLKEKLLPMLGRITGIDNQALQGIGLLDMAVAVKLSWAARRRTTRREDMAYCLMGILGVNMPLLYGEGHKAFIRLQEETVKHSDDRSIFAWQQSYPCITGPLAPSPDCFANLPPLRNKLNFASSAFALTNQGVSITVTLRPWAPRIYLAYLSYHRHWEHQASGFFLYSHEPGESMIWCRIHIPEMEHMLGKAVPRCKGWLHWIGSIDPKAMEIVMPHELSPLICPGRDFNYLGDDQKPTFGFAIASTPSIDDFVKSITGPKTVDYDVRTVNFGPIGWRTTTLGPFNGKSIQANLDHGEFGIVLMLEIHGFGDKLHWIGLGFDFYGVPFFIATTKEESLRETSAQNGSAEHTEVRDPDVHEALSHRAEVVNALIDRDFDYGPIHPFQRYQLDQAHGSEWFKAAKYASTPSESMRFPDANGIWAVKGPSWNIVLAAQSADMEEPEKLLEVQYRYNVPLRGDPCSVQLRFWNSTLGDFEETAYRSSRMGFRQEEILRLT